jgi:hypothetical protein
MLHIVVANSSTQFPPADKATDSTCKAKKEGRHARVDSATGTKNSTCRAWTYVVLTQHESPFARCVWKKRPQARRTLASTLKIPIFIFFSCSSSESHTEKKRPTGGWDRPTMYSVHRAMQMHVDVLGMFSIPHAVLRSPTGYMQCAGSTYPSLKSHWAHTVGLNEFRMYKALAPVRVNRVKDKERHGIQYMFRWYNILD